jgi:uncharacterized DUF497 family protein
VYLHNTKTFVFTFVIHFATLIAVKLERIEYEGFDWDYGNFLHAQQHDISFEAIEKIFEQELLYFLDIKNTSSEKRWIAVGELEPNRLAFVAFTIRSIGTDRLIRPISARYIHRGSKEEKIYEEIRKKLFEE